MTELGLMCTTVGITEARQANTGQGHLGRIACFAALSPFEVVAGSRKIVGLAQARRATAVLFSSAVHLTSSPAATTEHFAVPMPQRQALVQEMTERSASLAQVSSSLLTRPQVMESFMDRLGERVGAKFVSKPWTALELAQAGA